MHKVRGRRGLAAVRALWQTRDGIAAHRDVTPGRILPDAAIVAAAHAMPRDRSSLLATKGFHGRGAERYANRWVAALAEASDLPEDALPTRAPRADGPPMPRAWAEKDPVAARRLILARERILQLAEELDLPAENLLTPDYLRRTLWSPPKQRDPEPLTAAVATQLEGYGARPWQIALAGPVLVTAIVDADQADPALVDPDLVDPDPTEPEGHEADPAL